MEEEEFYYKLEEVKERVGFKQRAKVYLYVFGLFALFFALMSFLIWLFQ